MNVVRKRALAVGLFAAGAWFASDRASARADQGPALTTIAAATDRPAACVALAGRGKKPNVWRLTRRPTLAAYCDDIARAHALLESDPKAALEVAKQADGELPDQAATFTAVGRAELALADVDAAVKAFEKAKELDARSLDEPKAMSAFARALVMSKRAADAAPLYRALVPRASLLPDRERPLVYLRAAHALMAHAAGKPEDAKADLADAAAYLAEARTDTASSMFGEVLLSQALVFDRGGEPAKANAARDEAVRSGATFGGGDGYVATDSDKLAIAAMLAEGTDPLKGAAGWQKYLDANPPAPFAKAAKARMTSRGGARKP